MSETIADVPLKLGEYVDVYTLSNIPVGTSLVIQNKSLTRVRIQEASTKPPNKSVDGRVFNRDKYVIVTSGSLGVWAEGAGFISVQKNLR